MKNKVVIFGLAAVLASSATFAQGVENDDMYFTSKDRARLKAQKASEQVAYQASVDKKKHAEAVEEAVNPTDSYSARNENPEFAARSNSQQAQSDNQDYFVSNYRYNNASNLTNWNNNFNSWYGSSWYRPNYYSS
ncbi:MAG TPA: hypothetical protein VK666_01360, partial [Chryseolinea sp.]|nr:hypothetical protein [Chryseolinea sp.]